MIATASANSTSESATTPPGLTYSGNAGRRVQPDRTADSCTGWVETSMAAWRSPNTRSAWLRAVEGAESSTTAAAIAAASAPATPVRLPAIHPWSGSWLRVSCGRTRELPECARLAWACADVRTGAGPADRGRDGGRRQREDHGGFHARPPARLAVRRGRRLPPQGEPGEDGGRTAADRRRPVAVAARPRRVDRRTTVGPRARRGLVFGAQTPVPRRVARRASRGPPGLPDRQPRAHRPALARQARALHEGGICATTRRYATGSNAWSATASPRSPTPSWPTPGSAEPARSCSRPAWSVRPRPRPGSGCRAAGRSRSRKPSSSWPRWVGAGSPASRSRANTPDRVTLLGGANGAVEARRTTWRSRSAYSSRPASWCWRARRRRRRSRRR